MFEITGTILMILWIIGIATGSLSYILLIVGVGLIIIGSILPSLPDDSKEKDT